MLPGGWGCNSYVDTLHCAQDLIVSVPGHCLSFYLCLITAHMAVTKISLKIGFHCLVWIMQLLLSVPFTNSNIFKSKWWFKRRALVLYCTYKNDEMRIILFYFFLNSHVYILLFLITIFCLQISIDWLAFSKTIKLDHRWGLFPLKYRYRYILGKTRNAATGFFMLILYIYIFIKNDLKFGNLKQN